MNKLFPLHEEQTGPESNRPYYTQVWEPLHMSKSGLPMFQYERQNNEYFYVGQVINGSESDITQQFRKGTELITAWTASTYCTVIASDYDIYSLEFVSGYPNEYITSNTFTLSANDYLNFRIDGTYSGGGDIVHILFYKNTTLLSTDILHTGKNEIAVKVAAGGTDYKIVIKSISVVAPTTTLVNATFSCQRCTYDIHNNFVTYYGAAGMQTDFTVGFCTFVMQSTTHFYSDLCEIQQPADITDKLKISISSTVDYADIYYKGGFIQTLYRLANVRRSPEPKITIVGEERNGIIVQEKVITATKYQIKMKCSEAILDALITAIGATMTVTDQTGKVFNMYNVEISKPDWYRTNGVVTITFDDNINVYTQNQADL